MVASSLQEVLRTELPELYALAFLMCGSREDARAAMSDLVRASVAKSEAVLNAPDRSRALLGLLARELEENLGRQSEHSFESLDTLLRSDITRPIDLRRPGHQDDPGHLHLMLWELKRTCLGAVLSCLPPGVRIAFVLTDLAGLGPAEAATLLEIKESAYRVRLTRARKRVEDYLAPRCTHVDRENPCTCPGRLMIALDSGFVSTPPPPEEIPHDPHDVGSPRRDVGTLYRGLPKARLPDDEFDSLLSALA